MDVIEKGTSNFYDSNGRYNYNSRSTAQDKAAKKYANASKSDDDITYLLYNDEPDTGNPGSNYGHCKGVLGVSGSNGMCTEVQDEFCLTWGH